jgi:hypothetical protein
MHTEPWSENLKGRDYAEDLDTDGRIFEWIHLAQDREQWQTHVNMVMNFQVLQRQGIS